LISSVDEFAVCHPNEYSNLNFINRIINFKLSISVHKKIRRGKTPYDGSVDSVLVLTYDMIIICDGIGVYEKKRFNKVCIIMLVLLVNDV
jgi:hypothetical protein